MYAVERSRRPHLLVRRHRLVFRRRLLTIRRKCAVGRVRRCRVRRGNRLVRVALVTGRVRLVIVVLVSVWRVLIVKFKFRLVVRVGVVLTNVWRMWCPRLVCCRRRRGLGRWRKKRPLLALLMVGRRCRRLLALAIRRLNVRLFMLLFVDSKLLLWKL